MSNSCIIDNIRTNISILNQVEYKLYNYVTVFPVKRKKNNCRDNRDIATFKYNLERYSAIKNAKKDISIVEHYIDNSNKLNILDMDMKYFNVNNPVDTLDWKNIDVETKRTKFNEYCNTYLRSDSLNLSDIKNQISNLITENKLNNKTYIKYDNINNNIYNITIIKYNKSNNTYYINIPKNKKKCKLFK
jgi:inorganic pyrophosphatase/exopolyphosphatase